MEIIRLESGLFSINLSETEKELVDELTRNLLIKLGNESPQTLLPRLFPEAILNEPELESESIENDQTGQINEEEVIVGPSMYGLYDRSGDKVPGLSAEEYIYQSIVYPNEYIVEGYPANVMPQIFINLSEEELQALVSYLKTIE